MPTTSPGSGRNSAASLFGVPEAGQWLEEIQPVCGRLATDIQQLMPFMSLVGMLRNLLDDGVGLTPPRLILEGLAHASQKAQNDPNAGAEVVRTFMSRQISAAAADRDGVIPAIVIGPDLDTKLRQAANPGPNANSAAIEAADAAKKHFVETDPRGRGPSCRQGEETRLRHRTRYATFRPGTAQTG